MATTSWQPIAGDALLVYIMKYFKKVSRMTKTAVDLAADIQPISDFRANSAEMLRHVRETGRPIVLTQHGRGAAVLVDVQAYQSMVDELTVLQDIVASRADHEAGRTIGHDELMDRLAQRYS